MNLGPWSMLGGALCLVGSLALVPPQPAAATEFAAWIARPAALPFAWRGLREAMASGDGAEAFARGQQILHLLPGWTDGHVVFAYRFATEAGDPLPPAARAAAAFRRLHVALAWLEGAREHAGGRHTELLEAMAFLPEIAVAQEPGLVDLLAANGGAAALADHYLGQAERLGQSRAVRERRTFLAPMLCAGYLQAGNRKAALAVLDAAIMRSADVADRPLATAWAARLAEVRSALRGEHPDLTAVRADARFQALLPHLR